MILLAIDTSGPSGSIALARCEAADCAILATHPLEGGNFSAQLVPEIGGLLAKHGIDKKGIGGFAVASGPGSFTGLRVGLAAVKGLAEILEKPIAAVSLLEAVACANGVQGSVVAALDAGRRQAFAGAYEVTADSAICKEECLFLWEELAAYATGRKIITPDKTIADILHGGGITCVEVERPRADVVARIGWRKLAAGLNSDVAELEANYIRRTDAEILLHGQ
jgi:tRNA threonylcarbamoyladenosine biosynthesis protein TsaB